MVTIIASFDSGDHVETDIGSQVYRVYQNEFHNFKHLQLWNADRYDDLDTCNVLIKSNSFSDTKWPLVRVVIDRQQLYYVLCAKDSMSALQEKAQAV
jgi:hypothetical protein